MSEKNANSNPTSEIEPEPVRITLSTTDWDKFTEMLDNPPPPNDALKKLMREFGPWKESGPFIVEE